MSLRIVVAAALIINTHFSLCTGNFLSTVASAVAMVPSHAELNMTPSHFSLASCIADDEADTPEAVSTTTRCTDTQSCLSGLGSESVERIHTAVHENGLDTSPAVLERYTWEEPPSDVVFFASRDGPLYEDTHVRAHSLLKKE